MNWLHFSSLLYIVLNFFVSQIHSSGLFELQLKTFINDKGVDATGTCCSGRTDSSMKCIGTCRTKFRVCLKNYQAKIDTTTPCTFGSIVTVPLEGNSLNLTAKNGQNGFDNKIGFSFDFTWPGTFTLILEALHDTGEASRSPDDGVLIKRLSLQRVVEVSSSWTEDTEDPNLQFAFRVTCDENYYGKGCAKLCRKRDDQFGHYTCSAMGERVCLPGWQGDYCTKARCTPGCNEQHGHCTKPNECICSSGYKGALCDECEPYPGCVHGTCKKPWECLCNEGWGGLFCNQDLNYCTNHKPCQNGGTCFNTGQGSYTCKCAPGFTGTDCDTEINSCDESPCVNGLCSDDPKRGTYKCDCKNGWIGRNCEKETVTCAENPCLHGICRDTNLGFKCECPLGYSGPNCEVQVDECNPNPCENGGACINKGNSFECMCPSGFRGMKCEENEDDCQGNPCLNGGSCVDMVNQFRCLCIPGFIGSLCENKVDLCLTKPCANGGTCKNLNNDYSCTCRPGFTGKDCSVDVDECSSAPCRNGGTCVNRVNSFQCVCAGGFRGTTCDEEASSLSNWETTSGSISRHIASHHEAQSGRSDGLSGGQIALIAVVSVATPLVAFVAAAVVICQKRKRRRKQEQDDAEARKQNEQNASNFTHHHHNSMSSKRSSNSGLGMDTSHHMIKNTWDKSVNNMSSSVSMEDACLNTSMYGGGGGGVVGYSDNGSDHCYQASMIPPTLQRAKSQKQLNTDPLVMHRASQCISQSKTPPSSNEVLLEKRISVLSDACNTRWGVNQQQNRQLIGPCSPPHI